MIEGWILAMTIQKESTPTTAKIYFCNRRVWCRKSKCAAIAEGEQASEKESADEDAKGRERFHGGFGFGFVYVTTQKRETPISHRNNPEV